MTLKHLKVFVAVCEHGSITKAANALHIVQPAVSTTIAELEKHYKASIFDRINQRLVLTELGKELLIKAKRILEDFYDFEESATLGGQKPRLRIGSSLTLGKTLLPKLLTQIKKQLPQLEPIFFINKTVVIEEKLECGELDFGIVEGAIHSAHLSKYPFEEDHLVAVCSPDFSAPSQIDLAELACYPLLLREAGSASRDLFQHALAEKHLLAKPLVESVSNEVLISFAEAGHGIAILPERIISRSIEKRTLCPISIKDAAFTRTHYVAIHKNKSSNPLYLSVIDIIKNHCN